MSGLQIGLSIVSGGIVGFALGLLGGGGSILAVPLLLYLVGIHNPHVVIGSTALAVAVNAYLNLIPHARNGNVQWANAVLFALFGAAGAYIGSLIGKAVPSKSLLFLFALLMLFMAYRMFRNGFKRPHHNHVKQTSKGVPPTNKLRRSLKLAGSAVLVGALSGFFGIGGGFLIVPALMFATGMPMIQAIGTSLFSVGTFGLTTAISYGMSGLIDWSIVFWFIGGGIVGGLFGATLARRLSQRRQILNYVFSSVIAVVAMYMLVIDLKALHLGIG